TDPLTGLNIGIGTMTPGQVVVETATYSVLQSDVDAGQIVNTANVVGTDATNAQLMDTATVTVVAANLASIELTKVADVSTVQSAGQVITYTLTVTNTGNVTLTDVDLVDPKTGLDVNIGDMSPGETSMYTTTYTVTFDDYLALAPIENTADVTGLDPNQMDVTDSDTAVVDIVCTNTTLITGVVYDESDNSGLAGVPILLTSVDGQNADKIGVTDANGRYLFTDTGAGEFTVEVIDRNLNLNNSLYSDGPSKKTVVVEPCQFQTVNFGYNDNDSAPVIHGLVWYDINEDGLQNEWYDANDDGQVTENLMTGTSIDLKDWEWIDFNGDGSYNGPQNWLELNAAGFGNPDGQNLEITGPNGYVATETVSKYGYWKHSLPQGGQFGEFTISIDDDPVFTANAVTIGSSGLVKILSSPISRMENVQDLTCGFTTPTTLTGTILQSGLIDIGFGYACHDATPSELIANDDPFGEFPISYGGVIGNILDNDLLNGNRPDPADVDIQFTDFGGILGLMVDDNGEISILPGMNPAGEYILHYTLTEVADPDNMDDAIVTITLVNDEVDLAISKTSNEAEIYEGDEFEYVVVVVNNGDTDANQVVISDDLPNNVTYLSSSAETSSDQIVVSTSVTGSRITWTVPYFPVGGSITITIKVKAGDSGSIVNSVEVESDGDEITPLDNVDTDVNTILPFHIPNVITPTNQDGNNDTFEIKGLGKFANAEIVIFNRYGDHVFQSDDYKNDWNAPGQVAGTYFYVLQLTDQAGEVHEIKGWIQVIKD
ncbi:DUF7507 domain-containing protein, partial [Algoriphagus chordae]